MSDFEFLSILVWIAVCMMFWSFGVRQTLF